MKSQRLKWTRLSESSIQSDNERFQVGKDPDWPNAKLTFGGMMKLEFETLVLADRFRTIDEARQVGARIFYHVWEANAGRGMILSQAEAARMIVRVWSATDAQQAIGFLNELLNQPHYMWMEGFSGSDKRMELKKAKIGNEQGYKLITY